MPDHSETTLFLDEGVSTPARIFSRFRFRAYHVDPMSKEPAPVINLLLKFAVPGIRIARDREKQRVSAPFANVFIVGCPLSDRDVVVPA